jgi:hypothetical protein
MKALDDTRVFVEALSVHGGILTLDGQYTRGQSIDTIGPLDNELARVVYENLYTRPFPPVDTPVAPSSDSDITEQLEAANATLTRSENDWVVVETANNGSVVATRHGRMRRFAPGQFMLIEGVPPARSGARIAVQIVAGSRAIQPGFYFSFSENFRDVNDLSPIIRFYWNISASGAPMLVKVLTATLNRYMIPFELKVATRRETHARSDSAVLYLAQDHFQVTMLALAPALQILAKELGDHTPLFTKRLAPGLGLAENPPAPDSFGTARSRLITEALLRAQSGDCFDFDRFTQAFAQIATAAGLTRDALWLNPKSQDIYNLPTWVQAK